MNAHKTKTVEKPWGKFEQFTLNEETTVKLLHVKEGHRLSYQYHLLRSEFWRIVSGKVEVVLDGTRKMLRTGDSIFVPLRAKHRIEGIEDSVVLEIAYGRFDENDIVRVDDDYGRAVRPAV